MLAPKDSDGDGVEDAIDLCPNTGVDLAGTNGLKKNHYAELIAGTLFQVGTKKVKGRYQSLNSTVRLTDTHGCNCGQILGLRYKKDGAKGQMKYGCSIDTIRDFIINPTRKKHNEDRDDRKLSKYRLKF